MGKRSNAFQQLIRQIYDQVADTGVIVEESAMLPEAKDGTEREADVLLTFSQSGIKIRIAIECRDWRIKNDITWIDALVGKYRDLGINKIVAVSSSEFTPAALAKAKSVGIEALTLREALATDWSEEFIRVGLLELVLSFAAVKVSIDTDLHSSEQVAFETLVFASNGQQLGNAGEYCEVLIDRLRPEMADQLMKELVNGKGTLKDIEQSTRFFEVSEELSGQLYVRVNDTLHIIERIVVVVKCLISYEVIPVEHKVLGDLRISDTQMTWGDASNKFDVRVIQDRNKPGVAKMRFRPQQTKKSQGK